EVERIASQTSFNGLKVLDGTFGNAAFQVGANVGETINVSLTTGVRTSQIGQIASATGANQVSAAAIAAGQISIGVGDAAVVEIGTSDSDSAQDKVAAINAAGVTGLTATALTEVTSGFTTIDEGAAADADETYSLTINGEAIFTSEDISSGTGAAITGSDFADRVNLFAADTGVTASFDGTDVTFTAVDGRNITIAQTLGGTAPAGGLTTTAVAADTAGTATTSRGQITLSASDNISITGGNEAIIGFTVTDVARDTTGLDTVGVGTVTSAEDTIQRVDAALTTINSLRAEFGAIQNRFDSTIANLQTVSENLAASRGRILDADFAAETAQLTKAQILQQAGVSVLTQANSQPQLALSLLQ
ncbi:MAG: flagellin, partial [Pseudomonadota bacterium]